MDQSEVRAPLPGAVVSVLIAEGDMVAAGRTLVLLEVMKMEHPVAAAVSGTVTSVLVASGASVAAGDVLATIAAADVAESASQSTPSSISGQHREPIWPSSSHVACTSRTTRLHEPHGWQCAVSEAIAPYARTSLRSATTRASRSGAALW